MNYEDARDKLAAVMAGWSHSGVNVYYENTEEIDLAKVGSHFVRFVVEFTDGKQVNVSPTPTTRVYGTVKITVFARRTTGTRQALVYLGELRKLFNFKNLGGLQTFEAKPGGHSGMEGWHAEQVNIPFYADMEP